MEILRILSYQRPVEEGEALDVEHVDFVDEENPRRNLGLALLPPLGHLRVDLGTKIEITIN